ncbi:SubName: Full=Uncharacterized protein {ECO:0000313/EMBL:CCA67792.1} [Serendipita indica DSM 11827]|uniref:Uncharacterized protein n=1 Tax=Serendipita indica (strain DSM 11827) TaxID=1109443 RepID=G4T8Z9_SERID|nr:SubName: Full=Uncharacterized protein {ECO:0000313/EMBL:CCA67792.1} [Serendipita indica DSM 11827]CCA67792.1 hypothetical protein PIIN_01616 [Serendipita indica DSM 11827]
MFWSISFLLTLVVYSCAIILTNITVDDNDASISYTGRWDGVNAHPSSLNYGEYHTVTEDPQAKAVFTFTGIAVYYISSLWPYLVDSYVSLDGATPVYVNLTVPPGMPYDVAEIGSEVIMWKAIWGAQNLCNTVHTLTVTRGTTHGIVDAFRYTTVREENSPNTTSGSSSSATNHPGSPSASANEQPTTLQSKSSINIYAIVFSTVGALLLSALVFIVWKRNRHRIQATDRALDTTNNIASNSVVPYTYVVPASRKEIPLPGKTPTTRAYEDHKHLAVSVQVPSIPRIYILFHRR